MDGFESKVIEFNGKHNLIVKGDSLLIGVSGGADSMALLYFVLKQKDVLNLKIVVAHFNHMFRGNESDCDEKLVKDFCDKYSIQFVSKRKDIPKIISDSGGNSQLTSRNHRYEFYQEIIEEERIDKLLLAHHLDDLAENVLMNLARGVDSAKKIGIPVKREFGNAEIIRPFMCVGKDEIVSYLESENIDFREDSSNNSMKYTRNRIRKNVIPLLKEENSRSLQHIADFYEQIKADDEYMQNQAKIAFDKLKIECDQDIYSIEIKAIFEVDKTLQRRLFHLILEYVFSMGKSKLANKHIAEIVELAMNSQSSSILKFEKSLIIEKSFDKLLFYNERNGSENFEIELSLPGVTFLPNGDVFSAESIGVVTTLNTNEYVVSRGSGDFIVRSRFDGDRVEVAGLGRKKLKKLFSEMKIPTYKRDEWPIVSKKDDKSEIVWVPNVFKRRFDAENSQLFKVKFKNKEEV